MLRVPTSERGKKTYQKILKSAINLFKKKGYQEVSVSSICKEAGVGNSTFYQYFSTKDDVLKEIVEDLFKLIEKSVKRSIGSYYLSKSERLEIFLKDFFDSVYNDIGKYAVFRNAEFLNPEISHEFHNNMYAVFANSLFPEAENEISKRAAFIFIIGAAHFVITEYGIYKGIRPPKYACDTVFDFLYNGLDPNDHKISPEAFATIESVKPTFKLLSRGSLTHQKLLDAAEEMFGEKGYSKAKISDIANKADVGLGTFYIHFNSKIEALRELVVRTLEGLKTNLRRYVSRFKDRRDAEVAGYLGFCDFFKHHENMYSIVRETEFIDPQTANFYYSSISKSYIRPLEKAFENKEYRKLIPEPLSYALMGIGHLMGQFLLVQNDAEMSDCVKYIREISKLLMHGLKGFVEA